MISQHIKKAILENPDHGPTLQSLSHGAVEIRQAQKRGPILARKLGLHERLYARAKITDAEWNWACRYVRETEIAAGARLGRPEFEPAEQWAGPLIYNRQCAASGFLRRAHERITYQDRLILIAACVECCVMADISALMGLHPRPEEAQTAYINRISARVNANVVRIIQAAAGQKKSA